MLSRALVLTIGLFACLAILSWNDARQPVSTKIAQGMVGEHWFRIELSGRHVGYMYNKARQDSTGAWVFDSTTHFLLQDNSPQTITKQMTFSGRSPHQLEYAYFQSANGANTEVTRTSEGYEALVTRGTQSNTIPLDWAFNLSDFLGFEAWLFDHGPSATESHFVRDPDFEKLRIVQRTYSVLEHNEDGYLIQTNSMLAPTVTQLDNAFRPLHLTMSGVFQIRRAAEVDAVAIKEMQSKTNYLFPINQRLSNHTRLSQLRLKINNGPKALPEIVRIGRGTTSQFADPKEHIGEELQYPVSSRKIQELLQRVLNSADQFETDQLASALVEFAHRQLEYSENNPAEGVLAAIARGYGECTDFADLLTTLARAGQIPARTVYGLAYRDGPNPVFMYHAWNELYVDNRWIAVDPTWNQTEIDATHIPLSDQQSAALMLAHAQQPVYFEILDAAYL